MAVMDEFREERDKIKHGTFKEKWKYFWDYYKWHVIGGTLGLIMVIWIVYDVTHQNESVLYVAFLNCASVYDTSEYVASVEEYLGVEDGQALTIDSSLDLTDDNTEAYYSYETLAVRIAANELDVMVAEEEFIYGYASGDSLIDLTTVMTEEQMERYSDYFYYIDYALIESGYYDNEELSYEDLVFEGTAGHVSPEDMEQPVAVGVYISTTNEPGDYVCTSAEFNQNYYYSEPAIFTLMCYSEHTEAALQFLDFICGYTS
ncbi:MAG: hypothetical protein LUH58_00245 [Lachnospiraceae bacterium]|nr:hypothetical protein [Lachnospiraceae bacterium]